MKNTTIKQGNFILYIVGLTLTIIFLIIPSFRSIAGHWVKEGAEWKWKKDNGIYAGTKEDGTSDYWIDDNNDGIYELYKFIGGDLATHGTYFTIIGDLDLEPDPSHGYALKNHGVLWQTDKPWDTFDWMGYDTKTGETEYLSDISNNDYSQTTTEAQKNTSGSVQLGCYQVDGNVYIDGSFYKFDSSTNSLYDYLTGQSYYLDVFDSSYYMYLYNYNSFVMDFVRDGMNYHYYSEDGETYFLQENDPYRGAMITISSENPNEFSYHFFGIGIEEMLTYRLM